MKAYRLWLAYYRLEPWGQPWRRSARVVSMLATAQGAKLKEDFEEMFLPTFDPRRPTQTPEEMAAELAKLKAYAKPKKAK